MKMLLPFCSYHFVRIILSTTILPGHLILPCTILLDFCYNIPKLEASQIFMLSTCWLSSCHWFWLLSWSTCTWCCYTKIQVKSPC